MKERFVVRRQLLIYDLIAMIGVYWLLLWFYRSNEALSPSCVFAQAALCTVIIMGTRFALGVYKQVWRYGGIQCYMRLIFSDLLAMVIYVFVEMYIPFPMEKITVARMIAIVSMILLATLIMRMTYRYAYRYGNDNTTISRLMAILLRIFAGEKREQERTETHNKVKLAIIGAGSVGVMLADDLINNPAASYQPVCFVDVKATKVGKTIHNLPVLRESEATLERLKDYDVQEVVFAIPSLCAETKKKLYSYYLAAGYKIKVYDYPHMENAGANRHIRDFDINELLFRSQVQVLDDNTKKFYEGRTILITGGGGSIGSELCRQLAKMNPKKIILLDIYENGVYDVQQELRIAYGGSVDIQVEICSITRKSAVARVFDAFHPEIIIHAAAHKHVPLMEHNCIEAISNNVFGTRNLVELCEEYGAMRFMMVSTDKAVNPTNVMGATKRMCEMIVQSASTYGNAVYSATRFGNVLGSAGSVIPLFQRQIASGGPVTITDKRIIRYFMTIPEATQLVLQSGAMAKNGELFVLDMGEPVKILDLAENMIRMSGSRDIEIKEIGLRPGEKLYEELLVKVETLDKTDSDLIFIERDKPLDKEVIDSKLRELSTAVCSNDDDHAREVLRTVVPSFRKPDEVNSEAEKSEEMKCSMKFNTQLAWGG